MRKTASLAALVLLAGAIVPAPAAEGETPARLVALHASALREPPR